MSKGVPGHSGEERLLRLADGELAPRESAAVRDHLEACWECRAELESIQGAVADCVHYRKAVLQAHLPAAPAPWRDLSAGFAAIDREIASETSWWRLVWQAVTPPRFWVPAVAAGLLVVFVLIPWLRVTPTVQAAELLRRAVAAAETRPHVPPAKRRLQVRTKSKRLIYSAASSASADLAPVAGLFAAARYDWADPLSARSYMDWHSRQNAKTDEVIPDGAGFYQVRTRTDEGELAEAMLRLRQNDLQPVQGMFRFRGDEWVELTEMPAEPEIPLTARATPPPAGLPPLAAPAPAAAPLLLASVADELRVLEALHRIGADLGDPIEVARAGARVEVKGFGIEARRRGQIEQALGGVSYVSLKFVDEAAPAGLAAPPASGSGALAVKSSVSPLQPFLEQRLGGRVAIEEFGNQVFDRSESIMARAHAIQRLAGHFPGLASLDAGEQATYRALQRSHAQALVKLEREMADVLRPVTAGAEPLAAGAAAPPVNSQSLLEAARRLERSASMLLGAVPVSGDAAGLPARVAGDQAALERITRAFLESMGQ